MKKELLLRHIKKQTNAQEAQEVINWIDESKANEHFYISLLNMSAIENLSADTKTEAFDDNKELLDKAHNQILTKIINRQSNKSKLFVATMVAASLLLFISVGINLFQYFHHDEAEIVELVQPVTNVIHTYYTNSGVKGKIILPDSSIVWLNSCSKITYPEKFASNQRDIEFEGEGYFDVRKNPNVPMIVKTPKGMEIKVLGTKFMVKSYSNDSFEETTLFSGKIIVSNKSDLGTKLEKKKLTTEIFPGEAIVFNNNTAPIHSFNVDTLKRSAWKRGELSFDQMSFSEVCKILERWHGVEIEVLDPSLFNYTFTADLGSESLTQIIELMSFTMPISCDVRDNKVFIKKR